MPLPVVGYYEVLGKPLQLGVLCREIAIVRLIEPDDIPILLLQLQLKLQ